MNCILPLTTFQYSSNLFVGENFGPAVPFRVVRVDGHEVRQLGDSRICLEGGLQDVGVRQVSPLGLTHPDRGNREITAFLPIHESTEDGGAIESWQAAPVHRAGSRDEGTGVHVADKPIVGNGRLVRKVCFFVSHLMLLRPSTAIRLISGQL